MIGLLYIFGGFLLFIAVGMVFYGLRLGRLRRQRQRKGFSREQFLEGFRQLGIPDNVPAAVYDYYGSQKAWYDFPFSPDDKYSEVLHDDPWDIEDDQLALLERLGILLPPEYIRREYGNKTIKTLRDMVLWLDWIRQLQPTASGSGQTTSRS